METMFEENLISNSIAARMDFDRSEHGAGTKRSEHGAIGSALAAICDPRRKLVLRVVGRAHHVLLPQHGLRGTFWQPLANGRGEAEILLAPVEEPTHTVRIRYELERIDGVMQLIAIFNPNTIVIRNSTGAAALPDPETGEIPPYPSFDPQTVSFVLAAGFDLLDDLSRQVKGGSASLYRPTTIEKIRRGRFDIVQAQWRALLSATDASLILQTADTTNTRRCGEKGRGVHGVNHHSGITLDECVEAADASGSPGLMRRRRVGDGRPPWIEGGSSAQRTSIHGNLHLDVTADVDGIITIVEAAKQRLDHLGRLGHAQHWGDDWVDEFQSTEPAPTARLLSRAIFVLSQRIVSREMMRSSFASWLVPHVIGAGHAASASKPRSAA
jgi:hypothetical protein